MQAQRLVHIIDTLGVGGAEVLLVNTIRLLPDHQHIIITINSPHTLLSEAGMLVYAHHCLGVKTKKDWLGAIIKLRKYILSYKPALVHTHLHIAGIFAKIACPRTVPLFYSIHGHYGIATFRRKAALFLEKLTARNYHHLIGVSRLVLEDYQSHVPHSGTGDVLHNMVDEKFFHHLHLDTYKSGQLLRCVSVGNLKHQKNYLYTLKAFKLMEHQPIQLDIYGDGPERQRLQEFIDDNHIRNVVLKGRSTKIVHILSTYDAYIISSSSEGFGIAPLEALAVGLPVFASDIAVFREVAGNAAYFFNLLDINDLAKNLTLYLEGKMRTITNEERRQQAKSIGDQQVYIQKLKKIYNTRAGLLL